MTTVRSLGWAVLLGAALAAGPALAGETLPDGFVDLAEVAPSLRQDLRYAGPHNFVGVPVTGYGAARCLLTRAAAEALAAVEADLAARGLGLIVFDCYRPQRAVDHFVAWAADLGDLRARDEFYPAVDKRDLFRLGYIAAKSGHSRGSTVDVTLTGPEALPAESWRPEQAGVSCAAPYGTRFRDGGVDMGTGYDCFDERSHPASTTVSAAARDNRRLLAEAMAARGFRGIAEEYWHFTLVNEPHPATYFDFPISPRPGE